ncbi:polyprenyl synthetase family protein [Candidatus Gottesmanbacteria bacterium]|nr:polyprenyl synthetase family protein [Candidatus Gottesmanbacteria bacterium]
MDFLKPYKKQIDLFLSALLKKQADTLVKKLLTFATTGKTIRGSLLLFTYQLLGGGNKNDAIQTAAALELFHSSLLIHDDVIDNDRLRRGKESFWELYSKGKNSDHFGRSMAICAGDVGFFLAFELLSTLSLKKDRQVKLVNLFSRELFHVGIAQSWDVEESFSKSLTSKKKIEMIYRYKTARYTFSVPFLAASILANKHTLIKKFDRLGETLGLLYQIKDDHLGLFGKTTNTGKPIGNDIIQKKKTLIIALLMENITQEEKIKVRKIFTKKLVLGNDILYIQKLVQNSGTNNYIAKLMNSYAKSANNIIKSIDISKNNKEDLYNLVDFCLNRKQ